MNYILLRFFLCSKKNICFKSCMDFVKSFIGVAILRGMLSREEDGENPKLKYLLVECYAAVFASLFVHSVAVCDPKTIYRVLAKKMDAASFATVFGGGSKRQIKISTLHQLHVRTSSCVIHNFLVVYRITVYELVNQ